MFPGKGIITRAFEAACRFKKGKEQKYTHFRWGVLFSSSKSRACCSRCVVLRMYLRASDVIDFIAYFVNSGFNKCKNMYVLCNNKAIGRDRFSDSDSIPFT